MIVLNLFNQYEQSSAILFELFKKLQINVTRRTIDDALQQHPDYPSILSLSDSLKKWGVNNAVLRVEPEKLAELPCPCIAHIKTGGGSFIIIEAVEQNQVQCTDWKGKSSFIPVEDFLKIWSGVVLVVEKNEHSGEKNYSANLRKEWATTLFSFGLLLLPFFLGIVAIAAMVLSATIELSVWGFSLNICLKATGIIVSVLLLWHEVDRNSPVLQQICTAGKKVNCDAVLDSKAAKIFSWLSWSEVGFFYFTGGFLALLFAGSQAFTIITILAYLNALALPYTLFSVVYQWRVSRQWCPLCLLVQALLVSEFTVSLFIGNLSALQLTFADFALLIPAFGLPAALWYAMKPQLMAAQRGKRNFRQLQRIKYNPETFEALLQKQQQMSVAADGLGIRLGNPQAKISLIKVCNPYCGPCARAHTIIDELLKDNRVSAQIIFTATNDEKDYRSLPVKHLLALAAQNDGLLTKNALDDWYGAKLKDYEAFAAKYPLSKEDIDSQSEKIEAMKKWCDEVKVAYTPMIFMNGYLLPSIYNVADLKYFLEE
ncbi:MAG: cysteine peptidase family C39 domain-containing protein [Bacteroidales bacterium]|nr:cysteine peptidase family C39 domain-containing protein [Bacteroidales bacterium]